MFNIFILYIEKLGGHCSYTRTNLSHTARSTHTPLTLTLFLLNFKFVVYFTYAIAQTRRIRIRTYMKHNLDIFISTDHAMAKLQPIWFSFSRIKHLNNHFKVCLRDAHARILYEDEIQHINCLHEECFFFVASTSLNQCGMFACCLCCCGLVWDFKSICITKNVLSSYYYGFLPYIHMFECARL